MKTLIIVLIIVLFSSKNFTQNLFGNAIYFDGDGDYASTVNEPVFPTSSGTIEAWIKIGCITEPRGLPNGNALFSKNEEQWNEGDFYMFFESKSGKLTARIQSPRNQLPCQADVQSITSFWNFDETWFHTAFTWGSSGMKLFINGVLQSIESDVTNSAMNNIYNFFIGVHGYKSHNDNYKLVDFFKGQVDEVRIWNHQRTPEQLASLWASALDSSCYSSIDSGLVGYWKFDKLEDLRVNNDGVDDVRDLSVLHNHLDLTGDSHLVPSNITNRVKLTSFDVKLNNEGNVVLSWKTDTEMNSLGFKVQKSYDNIKYFTIGFVEGSGTTTEHHDYYFRDENIEDGEIYYRLKQLDYSGIYDYSKTIKILVK